MQELSRLLRIWTADPTTANAIMVNNFAKKKDISRGHIFCSNEITTLDQKKLFAEQIKNAPKVMPAVAA